MTTYNQLVSAIEIILTESGIPVDDQHKINRELIADELLKARGELIYKMSQAPGMLPPQLYTKTCCLEIICNDTDCEPGVTVENDKYLLTDGIVMLANDKLGLRRVYGGDGSLLNFEIINGSTDYVQHNPFGNAKGPKAYIVGNRIYLKNIPFAYNNLKYLCAIGIFEAKQYCNLEEEFPLPVSMHREIQKMVIRSLGYQEILNRPKNDIVNNNNNLQ